MIQKSHNSTKIAPVADETPRPFWSVMIPSYNCPAYIPLALKSILAQDAGSEEMEIEVIDDCSPTDILAVLVEAGIDMNRVKFYRHTKNVGMLSNWNSCIERSRGKWVHILHQDDLVLPGFYQTMRANIEKADIGAAYCRAIKMDEDGHWTRVMPLLQRQAGIIPNCLEQMAITCQIEPPSIVVKRSTYEQVGGFDSRIPLSLDWELYVRIANSFAIWYEPQPLVCYRVFEGNVSSRVFKDGALIADIQKMIPIFAEYIPAPLADQIMARTNKQMSQTFISLSFNHLRSGNAKAAYLSFKQTMKFGLSLRSLYMIFRLLPGAMLQWLTSGKL